MIVVAWVRPIIFSAFGINLYSYGVCIAAALGSCTVAMSRDLDRLGIKAEAVMFMMCFIPGFWFGSKAQMVISAVLSGEPMPYLGLNTGHSFMGSAIGGVTTSTLYGIWCGLTPVRLLDLIAPLVPLGHGVGKWGCFLSGDGCWGKPASPDLPWAMSFPKGMVPTKVAVHPTPLYESALSLALFFYLYFCLYIPAPGGRSMKVGRRTAVTLVLYGIERMLIEPYRRHPASEALMGLTEYQFLAVIFVLIGLLLTVCIPRASQWPLEIEKQKAA